MSTTCDQFCQCQKHVHLREAIPTGDIRGMTDEELRKILRIRHVTVPRGATRRKLIDLIRQSEDDSVGGYLGRYWQSPPGIQSRITSLSSNFTYKLVNNAVKIVAQEEKAKWLVWITVGDDRVCPICEPRHLRRYRPTWFLPNMPAHAGCFLKDTLVDTGRGLIPIQDVVVDDYVLTHKNRYRMVRQTHKHKYDGGVRKLLGCWMTDNHRVLTPEGWIRSDSIQHWDKAVISTLHLNRQNLVICAKPNITPSMTTEKNLLPPILFPFRFGVMPVSPINLDGEFKGWNSEVDVINLESIDRNNTDIVGPEDFKIPLFQRAKFSDSLHGFGIFNPFASRNLTTTSGVMGRPILGNSLLRSHLTPPKSGGFPSSSDMNSFEFKTITDGPTGTVVLGSESLHGHTPDVEVGDLLGRKDAFHYLTPTLNDIHTDTYKGFVYNLTVDEDESYAVGEQRLLVHNCRCQWEIRWEAEET